MSDFAWPGFAVKRFELTVRHNVRTSTSPYSADVQTIDLMGERWEARIDLVPCATPQDGAARESFFERLRGGVNRVVLGHLANRLPIGTMRGGGIPQGWINSGGGAANWIKSGGAAVTWVGGSPILAQPVAQLANTCTLRAMAGLTMRAGSLFGLGGQMVRNLTDVTFDSSGMSVVEFTPRARQSIPAYTAVVWSYPTATFVLKPGSDTIPQAWTPGSVVEGASIELIEAYP